MPTEKGAKSNCITVMVGKTTTVLEMEHAVIDFITLCENPWTSGKLKTHNVIPSTQIAISQGYT